MSSTIAATAGEPGAPAATRTDKPLGGTLLALLRRELWEHRYLWIAPLAVAVLLALSAVIGHVRMDVDDSSVFATEGQRVALLTIVQWALSATFYVLTLFIVSYYALDCLYAERRDRSILFWKSLPVSDGLTVGSKLLIALVVVPLGAFALSLVTGLVFCAIVSVRTFTGNIPGVFTWSTIEWLRTELAMLLVLLIAVLWYAPLAAYLLLVSAWAKRSPFLWATLPWVVGPILERITFGTHFLWRFAEYRTSGIWYKLALAHTHIFSTRHGLRPVGTLLEDLDFRGAFTDPDLWLGVAVAAALVYATVRIRRYRDDS
jgi:ABC-2 type transport system permease protein